MLIQAVISHIEDGFLRIELVNVTPEEEADLLRSVGSEVLIKVRQPGVVFCNWCVDPHNPDPIRHPDGQSAHSSVEPS